MWEPVSSHSSGEGKQHCGKSAPPRTSHQLFPSLLALIQTEGNEKFQFEASENKNIISRPFEFTAPRPPPRFYLQSGQLHYIQDKNVYLLNWKDAPGRLAAGEAGERLCVQERLVLWIKNVCVCGSRVCSASTSWSSVPRWFENGTVGDIDRPGFSPPRGRPLEASVTCTKILSDCLVSNSLVLKLKLLLSHLFIVCVHTCRGQASPWGNSFPQSAKWDLGPGS